MSTLNRGTIFDLDRLFRHQNPSYRYSNARNEMPKRDIAEQPRVDINDTGDAYELVAELPGVDKSNLFVTIEESELVIETKASAIEKNENIVSIRQERHVGGYKRSFNLGDNVDRESIRAQFKDGLLILTITKKKEDVVQKTKTIEIH